LADVKEELSFLKKVKGGRINNLKFAMQQTRDTFLPRSRSGSRSRSNSIPQTPDYQREDSFGSQQPHPTPESRKRGRTNRSRSNSALGATTVMAGIIAGSVAGWSPIERNYADNDAVLTRATAGLQLENRDDVEIHPGTKPDDPERPPHLDGPPSQIENTTPSPAGPSRSDKD
jgi:Ca2+-transporting ATPase